MSKRIQIGIESFVSFVTTSQGAVCKSFKALIPILNCLMKIWLDLLTRLKPKVWLNPIGTKLCEEHRHKKKIGCQSCIGWRIPSLFNQAISSATS